MIGTRDRTYTVVGIVIIGVIAELGAIGLYLRLLTLSDTIDASTLAVLVGAVGGLATLAGSALGILAPSPLSKNSGLDDGTTVSGITPPATVEIGSST
jgi:hypothetical protein